MKIYNNNSRSHNNNPKFIRFSEVKGFFNFISILFMRASIFGVLTIIILVSFFIYKYVDFYSLIIYSISFFVIFGYNLYIKEKISFWYFCYNSSFFVEYRTPFVLFVDNISVG